MIRSDRNVSFMSWPKLIAYTICPPHELPAPAVHP